MADMKWSSEDWARLGALIKKSRGEQGFSRKKLSEMSGVSEKSIQLTEEGRVPTRWPKSLDALEKALGWRPRLMAMVLDGYDPQAELADNSTVAAGGANYGADAEGALPLGASENAPLEMHPTLHARSAFLARLPEGMRSSLEAVFAFGPMAAASGASMEALDVYESAVSGLIVSTLQRGLSSGSVPAGQVHMLLAQSPLRPWRAAMTYKPMADKLREDTEKRFVAIAGGKEVVGDFEPHDPVMKELRDIAARLQGLIQSGELPLGEPDETDS